MCEETTLAANLLDHSILIISLFSRHEVIILYRGVSNRFNITCASGSPNLQLNSRIYIPLDVFITPAYKTPI